ncbi:MAG: hypothetical protein AB9856_02660 [Cellulosilyticaceae bacterium]
MNTKTNKQYFFVYLVLGLILILIGMIEMPVMERIDLKYGHNLALSSKVAIHLILKTFVAIGYYIVGYIYTKMLNDEKIKQQDNKDWKFKILGIMGIVILEGIMLVTVLEVLGRIGFETLGRTLYSGLSDTLLLLVHIFKILLIVSLLRWQRYSKNLKSSLTIFKNYKIILLAIALAITGAILNYNLIMYVYPLLSLSEINNMYSLFDTISCASKINTINCAFDSISVAYIFIYGIYTQNKMLRGYTV